MLMERTFPIRHSAWLPRDLEIRNAIFAAVHPFSPYLALATRARNESSAKGAISVWLPK